MVDAIFSLNNKDIYITNKVAYKNKKINIDVFFAYSLMIII